jgi:hypothetical protein
MPTVLTIFFGVLLSVSVSAHANPAWNWKNFEIIGQHEVSRAEIQALIPIKLGSEFQIDRDAWGNWCANIKTKLSLSSATCSAVRYSNFEAYFVVEVIEPGYEYRNVFRPEPTQNISLASPEVMDAYEKLYQRLNSLFDQGIPPQEFANNGYLDYQDAEMHQMVIRLPELVPPFRDNLLDVLRHDRDLNKREKAANLLNWTINDLGKTVLEANRLLDDPSELVRNNISRFSLHFTDKLTNATDLHVVINNLILQLDRPSHGDRNKALFNLFFIAQKFPEDLAYIKEKGLPLITYIADTSILSNVGETAKELLAILNSSKL